MATNPVTLVSTFAENEFPEGTTMLHSATGTFAGVRLPDGTVLKPWVSWELFKDASGKEVCEPLTESELENMGVFIEHRSREFLVLSGHMDEAEES